MPFADKFRAMMDLPFAGDTVGGFVVERVDVRHQSGGPGQYLYSVQMTLAGPGGQQGLRRALKALFSSHPMTFSGYGNPYQLWFGKPEIESLGARRYAVRIDGAGARVFLGDELLHFLAYLEGKGQLVTHLDSGAQETLVETYLEQYRAEIRRKVDRYRGKLRRTQAADRQGGANNNT
jgi:hypothetical protein